MPAIGDWPTMPPRVAPGAAPGMFCAVAGEAAAEIRADAAEHLRALESDRCEEAWPHFPFVRESQDRALRVSLAWLSSWYSPYIRVPEATFSSAPTTVVDCSAPATRLNRSFA